MRSESEEENENIETILDTPPKKKIKPSQKHRPQKFRDAWFADNNFKPWLAKVPENSGKAKCQLCNTTFTAELTVLKNHLKS